MPNYVITGRWLSFTEGDMQISRDQMERMNPEMGSLGREMAIIEASLELRAADQLEIDLDSAPELLESAESDILVWLFAEGAELLLHFREGDTFVLAPNWTVYPEIHDTSLPILLSESYRDFGTLDPREALGIISLYYVLMSYRRSESTVYEDILSITMFLKYTYHSIISHHLEGQGQILDLEEVERVTHRLIGDPTDSDQTIVDIDRYNSGIELAKKMYCLGYDVMDNLLSPTNQP